MTADHHQPATPNPRPDTGQQRELPTHPFTQALETWDAWSMANTMRKALQRAREVNDRESLASFAEHPEWTHGPDALEALRANHELVRDLTGWRWEAVREARVQGRGWHEIGQALDVEPKEARIAYLERLDRQREVAARNPDVGRLIGYNPALAELADDNQADRAWQLQRGKPNQADRAELERAELERRAPAEDDPGCPPDNGGRQAGRER
jgi:hypothetical protein